MKTTDYIESQLKKNLSSKRYNHSLGCAKTAYELAKMYNLDKDKAYLAGLVHDCAKNFEDEKSIFLTKEEKDTFGFEKDVKMPEEDFSIAKLIANVIFKIKVLFTQK